MNHDCESTETPVNETCNHCEEPIALGDQGVIYDNGPVAHLNCFLRGIVGSVAHQLKQCGCFVKGATEGDPPELTRRQAADKAVELNFLIKLNGYMIRELKKYH